MGIFAPSKSDPKPTPSSPTHPTPTRSGKRYQCQIFHCPDHISHEKVANASPRQPPANKAASHLIAVTCTSSLKNPSDMLTNLEHSVMEAADGAKALELLGKSLFDVIVTDLALGMSGEDCHESRKATAWITNHLCGRTRTPANQY
jgi:hypothetical protein